MAKNQRRYAADEPRPTTGRPPRLSGDDMLLIARLHARGRSLRTIARIVSVALGQAVGAPTIGRWLRRAQEPQEDVQMALASLRAQAVEGWGQAILRGARDGRHAPAKDLLVAAGAIERDAPTAHLTILVGDGVTPVGVLPKFPSSNAHKESTESHQLRAADAPAWRGRTV